LTNGSPKVMLFAIDLDENPVDKESIALTSVFSFQAA
jgi:hypothetical protein